MIELAGRLKGNEQTANSLHPFVRAAAEHPGDKPLIFHLTPGRAYEIERVYATSMGTPVAFHFRGGDKMTPTPTSTFSHLYIGYGPTPWGEASGSEEGCKICRDKTERDIESEFFAFINTKLQSFLPPFTIECTDERGGGDVYYTGKEFPFKPDFDTKFSRECGNPHYRTMVNTLLISDDALPGEMQDLIKDIPPRNGERFGNIIVWLGSFMWEVDRESQDRARRCGYELHSQLYRGANSFDEAAFIECRREEDSKVVLLLDNNEQPVNFDPSELKEYMPGDIPQILRTSFHNGRLRARGAGLTPASRDFLNWVMRELECNGYELFRASDGSPVDSYGSVMALNNISERAGINAKLRKYKEPGDNDFLSLCKGLTGLGYEIRQVRTKP